MSVHVRRNAHELDATPFSMTKEGLVHMERGRFEKKDQRKIDDRRGWSLGFSNKSRLALLNTDKGAVELRLSQLDRALKEAREALNKNVERANVWERLSSYTWEQINAPYWQGRLESVQADLDELEKSGGDLEVARSRWDAAKDRLQKIQDSKGQLLTKKGSLGNDKAHAQEQLGPVNTNFDIMRG